MLDSVPGAQHISDAFRHGVVDSMFDDPEVWEGYSPGFSAPVIVRAVREARRQGGLPRPATSSLSAPGIGHGSNTPRRACTTCLRFDRMPRTS
jgi:hypothetical protein